MIIVILALSVTMSSSNSIILIVALMLSAITIVISQESCNVCNCQFNNVQILDQLIATKVNAAITGKLLIRIDNYYYKYVHVIIILAYYI